MTEIPPLMYTDIELESYIPSGWRLAPDGDRDFDQQRDAFRFSVLDSTHLDWTIEVERKEAASHGRMEALRQAVDELNRKRFKSWF